MVDAADRLEDWIGRTEQVVDKLSPWPVPAFLSKSAPRTATLRRPRRRSGF